MLTPLNPLAVRANGRSLHGGRRHTGSLHWRHYLLMFVEHRGVALGVFLTVLGLSIIWTYRQTPVYRATATIQVDSDTMKVLNIQDVLNTDTRDAEYINTQVKILQSRTLCEQVVQALHLDQNPIFIAYAGGDLVGALQGCLSVDPERGTSLLDIHIDNPNPQVAADLANGVAQQFIKQNLDKKMAASTEAVRWLRAQAEAYKVTLEQSEAALAQYRQHAQSVSLDAQQNIVLDKLKELNGAVTKAQQARLTAESDWNAVKTLLDSGRNPSEIPAIMNSPKVSALRQQLSDKQIALAVLHERYREQHPSMIAIQTELNEITNKLSTACQEAVDSLQSQYVTAKANEDNLQTALKAQEQEALRMDAIQPDYNTLKRNAEADRQLYESIVARMKETSVAGTLESNNIRLVDPVQVPGAPFKPRRSHDIGLGFFLGLGAAFAACYVLHAFDDKIKTYEDIDALGLPLLTGVPRIDLKDSSQNGRVLLADPHSISAEAFRSLRASITLRPEVNTAKPLMITSTVPGEGKSVVSANLAIAFASNQQHTLLIDCDLHHPAQHLVFPSDPDKGLGPYLMNGRSLQDVVQRTDIPNLDVLHVGDVPPNAHELLGSDRVRELITRACQEYDRVIIDSPPVTAVSDPLVLLPYVQGVVYVIGFDKIRREIVARTMQKLRECGAPLVGVVMNNINHQLHGYYNYPYRQSYYHQKRKGNGAGSALPVER